MALMFLRTLGIFFASLLHLFPFSFCTLFNVLVFLFLMLHSGPAFVSLNSCGYTLHWHDWPGLAEMG